MAEGRLLRRLIKAGVDAKGDEFRAAAEDVVSEERAKRHHLLANDLERILRADAPPRTKPLHAVPQDRERGFPLVDVSEPRRGLDQLVFAKRVREELDRIVSEHHRADLLASHGLLPVRRALFAGPPGTGKTSAAEALAYEIGAELVVVRVDAVISSFLGETAANLRRVFEFLEGGRFVALFDEFDALGKERDDASEHGEIRRVVNAFLQQFDAFRGSSLLIAATNHEGLLDRALWRRFDEVVMFARPTPAELRVLVGNLLRAVPLERGAFGPSTLTALKGRSHAEVETIIRRAVKIMVLSGADKVSRAHVRSALAADEARRRLTKD